MGAATAALLGCWAPRLDIVLVEAGGLPNEGGATVASPGLLPPVEDGVGGVPPASLRWARRWLEEALPEAPGPRGGWLKLLPEGAVDGRPLEGLLAAPALQAVRDLTGVAADHPAVLSAGGYVSAEALAYRLAQEAVRKGADLMLNTRARPVGEHELVLERLAFDRRMRLGVRASHQIRADAVVVACGADGAEVVEGGLDRPMRLEAVYRQFPRVRLAALPAGVALPVVGVAGWHFRPAPGGAWLVPPVATPDPVGYAPVGGRLLGVPVGLRRELLDALLEAPELAALLASGHLDLGKTVRSVRGARCSAPPDGRPVAQQVGERWWLLAGSGAGLLHDLTGAAEVAAAVAADVGGPPPPWPPPQR